MIDALGIAGADRRSPASMRGALARSSEVSMPEILRVLTTLRARPHSLEPAVSPAVRRKPPSGRSAAPHAPSGSAAPHAPSGRSAAPHARSDVQPRSDADGHFVAIDFETADTGRDSACAIGVVRVEGNAIVGRVVRLIRPPRRTFQFTYIHGIRWADVEREPTFGEVFRDIAPVLEGVSFLAAHNASFDQSVLHACCRSHGIVPPPLRFECTVKWARRTWGIYPTNLPAVCSHLGLALKHHDAGSDAEACARIMMAARGERPGARVSAMR